MDRGIIEEKGIYAVSEYLTDIGYIKPYLSSNDKTPMWDGSLFVYKSKEGERIFKELLSFFSCRIGTGVFNIVWMFVTVDLLSWSPLWMKLLSALIVGIINYLVGKLMIFKKK